MFVDRYMCCLLIVGIAFVILCPEVEHLRLSCEFLWAVYNIIKAVLLEDDVRGSVLSWLVADDVPYVSFV